MNSSVISLLGVNYSMMLVSLCLGKYFSIQSLPEAVFFF